MLPQLYGRLLQRSLSFVYILQQLLRRHAGLCPLDGVAAAMSHASHRPYRVRGGFQQPLALRALMKVQGIIKPATRTLPAQELIEVFAALEV